MTNFAVIFPGQGSQFPGMGYDLYKSNEKVKSLFSEADDILGFALSNVMFNGTEEELKQTKITQPAIFLHSIAELIVLQETHSPNAVAGHSLGEFSSLVANNTISFEDGLKLVFLRAKARLVAKVDFPTPPLALEIAMVNLVPLIGFFSRELPLSFFLIASLNSGFSFGI